GLGGLAHRDRTGREQIAAAIHDARTQPERAIAALVAEELGLELRPQLLRILVDQRALAHHRRELADRERLAVAKLCEHAGRGVAERRADTREAVLVGVAVDRHLETARLGRLRVRLRRALVTAQIGALGT